MRHDVGQGTKVEVGKERETAKTPLERTKANHDSHDCYSAFWRDARGGVSKTDNGGIKRGLARLLSAFWALISF